MDFAKFNYLYLLLCVPIAIVFLVGAAARRRAALANLGSPRILAVLSANVSRRKRRWKTLLWFVTLVSLIVALARPRWGANVAVKVQQGVEVMVVLDVSASMLAEDIKPNRLTRAKLTVAELMDRLGGNEVGLVVFSGAAFVQFPLTADFNTARSFLDAAGPLSISRSGTALEEALRVALDGFPEDRASGRVVLLLTDGESHEGDPLAATQLLAEQGVVVHAIGFGSPNGEPIPLRDAQGQVVGYQEDAQGETVLSKLDELILQQVASETGGLYFRASAAGEEVDAMVDAIENLSTGGAQTEGQFEIQGIERFALFAGLACLALTLETVLGERKRDAI